MTATDLDALYQEIILDHYKQPLNKGLRGESHAAGAAEVHHVNPTCGDEVTLRVHLAGPAGGTIGETGAGATMVRDISYDSVGCSISQASTSVMTDLLIGRTVEEAMRIHDEFVALMQGRGTVQPDEDVLGDGVAFAGVAKFPARVKCALLSWMAWKDATLSAAGTAQTQQAQTQQAQTQQAQTEENQ